MGMRINTNLSSQNAQRAMERNNTHMRRTLNRLSSGLRINGASDDAAGLAIGNRMSAQIRGLDQAIRNSNDGVSMVQVAEGAQNQISSNLGRIRELSVQAANGTLSSEDRAMIQQEVDALTSEIDRISEGTEFNGQKLLDGSYSRSIQVGDGEGDTVDIQIEDTRSAALGVSDLDLTTAAGAQAALSQIDTAIDTVSSVRASLGSTQNRLDSTISNLGNRRQSVAQSRSQIMDADMAAETSRFTQQQVLNRAGIAVLAQANSQHSMALHLLK